MKNLINRSIVQLSLGLLGLMALGQTAIAQDAPGSIAFGFNAGGNKYYGNYTDSRFGFQGEAFIRWNVFDWLSVHAAYNGGVLGWKTTPQMIANENNLFPGSSGADGSPIGSINHTRVGGWDLMASYNVFPDQSFVPFVTAGVEALNFEPDNASPVPLKGNAVSAYSKNVMGGLAGVGFEMYISPKVVFNGKGLLHFTGTDWLDDYSDPTNYRQDAYITMGLGFSYYIFAPETVAPPPAVATIATHHYYYTHDTVFMTRVDTVLMAERTNTMYMNPKVNTVFYFPGTLFLTNTDQFNAEEPNNISNLYQIRELIDQCPGLKVEVQGYASQEGTPAHNQELSERRADRIKNWLIDQGVSPDKITRTIGYGEARTAVPERTDVSPAELEAARVQNRRAAVMVVQTCDEMGATVPAH